MLSVFKVLAFCHCRTICCFLLSASVHNHHGIGQGAEKLFCEAFCRQCSCVVGRPWWDLFRTSDSSAAYSSTTLQMKGQLNTNGPKYDESLYLANATKIWFNVSSLSKCFSSLFDIFGFNSYHSTVCGMFSMSFTLQQTFAAAINKWEVSVPCWMFLAKLDGWKGCSYFGYAWLHMEPCFHHVLFYSKQAGLDHSFLRRDLWNFS